MTEPVAVITGTRPAGLPSGNLSRATARWILAGLAVLLVAGMWQPLPRHGVEIATERTDSSNHRAIIERIARGEPYYQAVGSELRARGYPSSSVFNFRLPTLFVALARAPWLSRALLVVLIVALLVFTVRLFARAPAEVLLLAVLAQVGAAATALTPLGFVLHEPWAGNAIALSALAYAFGRTTLGAGLGLAALFTREIVAPYAALCMYLALRGGRRRELALWSIGVAAWVVVYAMHASAARQAMLPGDLAHPTWVQFGGLRFVLATIGFGGWLYLMPTWVPAVACVLLVAAMWAPVRADHVKGTVVTYLGFFAVVGQPFNQSWGLLTAPTWAIAYGLGVQGLVRLVRQAR
jgi:hypothetical protein